MDNLKIIYKKTDDLIPYINNPRNNDNAVDKVASSIKNFGFKVPIVVDGDNEIIAGHTRLKAAKKLGMDEVPCIVADDLSDEQIRAYRLVDNRAGEFSEWDMEILQEELKELGKNGRKEIEEMFGLNFEKKQKNDAKSVRYVIVTDEEYDTVLEIIKEIEPERIEDYILGGIKNELGN